MRVAKVRVDILRVEVWDKHTSTYEKWETGKYASRLLKDWGVQLESIISSLVDLSGSSHLPSRLTQRVMPYFLEPVWLGSKDSGVRWAGSLTKQQPEPLQRSLSQEPLQVAIQEMEPKGLVNTVSALSALSASN